MKKLKDYHRYVEDITKKGWRYDEKLGHIVDKEGRRKSYIGKNGYYRMCEWAGEKRGDKESNWYLEHRVIWLLLKGSIDEKLVINHIDSDRGNNHIENLELVTPKQNIEHAVKVGAMKDTSHTKGNPMLSETEVKAIKYLRENGWDYGVMGRLFAPDSRSPWHIAYTAVKGIRYGWIDDPRSIVDVYPTIVMATRNNSLTREQQISDALLGIAGEAGEVVDLMKKHLYQGHDFDEGKLLEEVGDLLYYVTWLCVILYGLEYTELLLNNMDKLCSRYPEGFDPDKSMHRAEGDV